MDASKMGGIDPNLNDAIASIFCIGLFIIYIPQYYKLAKKRSGLGFNIWFMFLGHTAAWLSIANALIYYLPNWKKCSGLKDCTEGFLGLGLIVLQWLLYWIQYIMILYYTYKDNYRPTFQLWLTTFIGSHILSITGLSATIALYALNNADHPGLLEHWANFIQILISIMFLSHYVPQIWETWKLKSIGSISLITLGMMCPGTFGWTVFLALQGSATSNSKAGAPEIWVPYLLVGVSQLCLLILGLYYDYKKRKERQRNNYLLVL